MNQAAHQAESGAIAVADTRRQDVVAVLLLTGLWLIPLLLIGTSGEFPLNDDWAYARATDRLVADGQIERVGWTYVPLVTHACLGALSLLTFGGHFEAYRFVGLFMGWLGTIGAYALCRQLGAKPVASSIAAACLGLNPIQLNLSYTFMTDVPFAALCTWSLFFLARGARTQRPLPIVFGTLFALLAILERQTGMAIPLAFGLALVISSPLRVRSWLIALGVGGALRLGYLAAIRLAFGPDDGGNMFTVENFASYGAAFTPVYHIIVNGSMFVAYLGWFLAPVILLVSFVEPNRRLWLAAASALATLVCLLGAYRLDLAMPLGMNIILDLGVGPRTVQGAELLPALGEDFWRVITGLGFFAAFLGIGRALLDSLPRVMKILRRPDWLMVLGFSVIYVAPHLVRSPVFDRYLIALIPPLGAALLVLPRWSGVPSPRRMAAAIVVLLVLGGFGTVGTRDYMEHHRLRWSILNDLLASGVSSERINGGFEFNGSYRYVAVDQLDPLDWYYTNDDEYLVTHDPTREGYDVVESRSFTRWMPPGEETLYLQHEREPGASRAKRMREMAIRIERIKAERAARAREEAERARDTKAPGGE